jgi:hypothetical protein
VGTLTPIALYISTFVSHKDRAGFIDAPKTSSSLRKTGLTFSLDELLFVSMKPARSLWLTNVEIYKAIGVRVPTQCIKGIQRIRDMWRIYMDNEESIAQFEHHLIVHSNIDYL